jgi:hypothetical protein
MGSRNSEADDDDRPRRVAAAPPPIPSSPTPAGIPSAATVSSVSAGRSRRRSRPLEEAAPARRSILPVVLICGFITVLAVGGAVYFAMESFHAKDQLAEANRNAAQSRDNYEQAAGIKLEESEQALAHARATGVIKEKELNARIAEIERDRDAAESQAAADLTRAKNAQSQSETKLAGVQGQLAAANQEMARLRSQASSSNQRADDLLRSSSNDIRSWFTQQIAALPQLHSQNEIRLALRKHEMSRLFDAEKKKLDRIVYEAAGTIELGNSESGLAFRSAILKYPAPLAIGTNVADVKLVYRWTVNEAATSLDPGDDSEILSYSGVAGGSPDGSKELRFDYRKTDDRFQKLDAMSPVAYKGEKTRMVFCIQFKEKGDSTQRWLIFRANALERGK